MFRKCLCTGAEPREPVWGNQGELRICTLFLRQLSFSQCPVHLYPNLPESSTEVGTQCAGRIL